ncbi:MAG TPA: hypothetical protein VHA11_07835, partial [Bryobacteraceae bacterium]|nr:hypothetical protein [Bryobacteraceae bacterium]
EAELEIAAHRLGFANLEEVDHCVLEPGGVLDMRRKAPSGTVQPAEIAARLDELGRQFAELRSRLGPANPAS